MSNLNDLIKKELDSSGASISSFDLDSSTTSTASGSPSTFDRSGDRLIEVNSNQSTSLIGGLTLREDNDSILSRGSSSSNPRSKRPKPKPSSALIQAKMNAQRKKKQGSSPKSPDFRIIVDHLQPARDSKDRVQKATGVVYDYRMVEHKCLWDEGYPERPERFSSVLKRCKELGLIDRCKNITPRFASEGELLTIHTQEHIEKLRRICHSDNKDLEALASIYDAIYFHPSTFDLSLLSTGCTIDLVNSILEDKIQNGMAIIRPPGHHAMKSEYCGYCYFNNVAIAAKLALEKKSASKILIVDFDVHHGQATQQAFYNDPRVLYFSTHRYENGTFWPNLIESDFNYIGTKEGIGFNCNIPLNKTAMGNADFVSIWHQILLPMAYQFNPDLVIVSAGFDAALGCFEGEMEVTPQFYPHLIWPLMGLANGKIAVILEGGYCLKSLAEGAALTLRTLLGDPCPRVDGTNKPSNEIVETILNASYMLKPHWNLLAGIKSTDLNMNEESELKSIHIPMAKYDWKEPKPAKYATRDCYPIQSPELAASLDERLDKLILNTSLAKSAHKVGLIYDEIMLKHRNTAEPGHPEKPDRIADIFACHVNFGLIERCLRIGARKATDEELCLIHTKEHLDQMKLTASQSPRELYKLKEGFNSVFFNNDTYEAAQISAGSLLEVVDNVMNGVCQSGVAIIRPPGHHAEVDEPCGFCIFNNVALAAKYAIENFNLKRILILDWDIHHGNGIQRMFLDDPRVLYISIHRYDYGGFFPCSTDADYLVAGSGKGLGYTVNIPWNGGGMGDTEYLTAFTNVCLPIAYEFNPELVLVSSGFDAANGDPLGGCKVSPEGYAHMTRLLASLANGRVILALEGGYNLTSISYSMTLCTKALLGDPIPPLTLKEEIKPSALTSIQNVLSVHSKYWTSIAPFRKLVPSEVNLVPIGSYHEPETLPIEKQMEKLTLEGSELDKSGGDEPAVSQNESEKVEEPIIPDPPISSGEPSLSIPSIIRNTGVVEEGNTLGSGETGPDQEPLPIPPRATEEAGPQQRSGTATGGASAERELTAAEMARLEAAYAYEDNDGFNFIQDNEFAIQPISWCPHLSTVTPVPNQLINTSSPCEECGSTAENWVCLVCYKVLCSRYVREHMVHHSEQSGHNLALSFSDLSVWCFGCENYIDNELLREAKTVAHRHKFGSEVPLSSSAGAVAAKEEETEGAVGGAVGGADLPADFAKLDIQISYGNEDGEGMHLVTPLSWCPHLSTVEPLPGSLIDTSMPCEECGSTAENWTCLVCYKVLCSRYVREHMVYHSGESGHNLALSFSDLSVWCFCCESYIDNDILGEAKCAAHRHKFGSGVPLSSLADHTHFQ